MDSLPRAIDRAVARIHRCGRCAGRADIPFRRPVSAGLDDRSSSGGYLKKAEQLMAEAVGAESLLGAGLSECAGRPGLSALSG